MPLKLVVEPPSLLRFTDVLSSEFRVTTVCLRAYHAFFFRPFEAASAEDSVYISVCMVPAPDELSPSDAVFFGSRYGIDCFFGGLSFGGSPFSGRIQ